VVEGVEEKNIIEVLKVFLRIHHGGAENTEESIKRCGGRREEAGFIPMAGPRSM
jgi:hypothetical protein